jgi:hypothetical protein
MQTAMQQQRKDQRHSSNSFFALSWQDPAGQTQSARARCVNVSKSGLRLESGERLDPGATVRLEGEHHGFCGRATVRYCVRHGESFAIGLEFGDETKHNGGLPLPESAPPFVPEALEAAGCLYCHRQNLGRLAPA